MNFIPHNIKGYSQNDSILKEIPDIHDVKWNEESGFVVDTNNKLWVYQNWEISSYKEMIPENMVKNINKDNLLNDLKLMNIKNVKEITLTRWYLWVLDTKGDLYSLFLPELKEKK